MNPERWEKVKELFDAALQCEPGERRRFLERICGDDIELREEVASLLASHEEAGSFITADAIEDAAHLLMEDGAETYRGRRIGHYRLLSMLGKGGMGEVYRSVDTRLGREVALKLLPAEFAGDTERVKRFEREARIASALNHPNILTIYEIGRDGETLFITAELVKGQTLRRRMVDGTINPAEAIDIALQMASALEAAHGAGVVHRDIKPENVMLRPDGYVKILDFGLAKSIEVAISTSDHSSMPTRDSYETAPGALIGTFRYMSPEQARGQSVDHRSDLWSLGGVFYEMLAGAAPFDGDTPSDIIAAILTREPQRLSEPSKPELQNIMIRALAKERDRRYQSAHEMLRDLQELSRKFERRSDVETSIASRRMDRSAAARDLKIKQIDGKKRRRKTWLALIALPFILAVSVILGAFVRSMRPLPSSFALESAAPERVIGYSIIVQKMLNGKELDAPFEASGHESFESGWKFRLRLVSPQAGYLYLLNEGPASDGDDINYRVIFPIPSINDGSALIAANEPILTGWYVFAERPGVEKLWVVWTALAAKPFEEIKDKVNPVDRGLIRDTVQRDFIREWLAGHAANKIVTDRGNGVRQTVIRGQGNVLASLISLKHQSARLVGLSDPIRGQPSYHMYGRDGDEPVEWWLSPAWLKISLLARRKIILFNQIYFAQAESQPA
jgi:serine/threonine protein kinase